MLAEKRVQSTDLVASEGSILPIRIAKSAGTMVADAHAHFYDAVRRGNCYTTAETAGVILTVAATTAATGLFLWNPPGSGKSLVLLRLMLALDSLPAAAAGVVIVGGPQTTVPATTWTFVTSGVNGILPALMGGANLSVAQATKAAQTVASTIIQRWVPGGPAAAVTATTNWTPFIQDNIDGELIVGPGNIIGVQTVTTAMTAGVSLTWEEVPVT